MVYLHKGDYVATTAFSAYPCNQDEVYVAGLQEGDLLISSNPEFLQNGNGYVAIDDRYTQLRWTRYGELEKEFEINWKNDCGIIAQATQEVKARPKVLNQPFEISAFAVLAFGCLAVIVTQKVSNAKK